jgi:hypothetical protein
MPPAAKREPIVPVKVKAAIAFLYDTPNATILDAARHVKIDLRKLKFLMTLPHSQRWLLQDKAARLAAITPSNIAALVAIRDERTNQMASVHAVKALEGLLDTTHEKLGLGREIQGEAKRLPGLQIVVIAPNGTPTVVAGPPPSPLIEANPAHETVPASSDE